MVIPLTFNVVLLLTGILVGLITTVALFADRTNKQANIFLAALVLICVGSLFHNFLIDAGIYAQKPGLYFLPVILSLGIGPLLYLYINRLIFLHPLKKTTVGLHLLPVALQFLFYLICFLQNGDTKYSIYANLYEPYISPAQNLIVYLSVSIYIYLSFKEIAFYKIRLNFFYSNTDKIALQWLNRLLRVFIAYYILAVFFALISSSFNISANYFPSDFIRCVIIFTIAAFALKQNSLIHIQHNLHSIVEEEYADEEESVDAAISEAMEEPASVSPTIPLPEETGKAKEINELILKKIITMVEGEKLYLNEELTIADVAKAVGYSTKTISHTINNGLGRSFSLFINEYRVNLFKEKRASGNFNHMSIMGLAYDCGFNSKSTFNRIYKEITGSLPKEHSAID